MDRRTLIALSSAGVMAGASSLRPSRKAYAQAADPYGASTAAHAIATGNAFYSSAIANDWYTIQNTLSSVLADRQGNNRDAEVSPAANYVSPSQVH
ncbi:hypothetical protein [Edaphobacter modestus]|uniref:hypothetical protein n=1 Tax=Edaphobacter modestus TaxID=388466 RepID=UPI00102AA9FC|nr:hypothetical protein [Edaphobacter modestus]